MNMNVNNVNQAVTLVSESRQLSDAVTAFEHGGAITRMMVESGEGVVHVDTRDWEYPPQMTEAILNFLRTRKEAVDKGLEELGVDLTAIEPKPEPEPPIEPATAAAPRVRQR